MSTNVRQKCANCNISSRSYPTLPHKKWFHFNIHAFVFHTELLKWPDNADLDKKQTNNGSRQCLTSCWGKINHFQLFDENHDCVLVWHKCRDQWGHRVLSKIHKTFHIYSVLHHFNYKKKEEKQNKKASHCFWF